ncbi:hypothetical protein [Paracoccus aminophilus]|uniref:Uncharacterized protein n=1 Tax=Paracoccus aminophilus JCM 7686 TaxID=1367847 RepID=S5YWT9_PARAH|nr:hypothetical protein [Paracoccus aminophilus]AGT09676.1 hypothetical protein JCM7686_2608 [Paracoccus aminophilus JCM 7686]
MTAPTNPAPTVCSKLNAVADALNKWADAVRDGRQVEPSVTGLRLMATAVRSAAIQPASAQPECGTTIATIAAVAQEARGVYEGDPLAIDAIDHMEYLLIAAIQPASAQPVAKMSLEITGSNSLAPNTKVSR